MVGIGTEWIGDADAIEQHQRAVARRALTDRACQQFARGLDITSFVRVQAAVQELLGLALTLGDRLARPIDVGASAIVIPVEENDARPDIDRLFVVFREVMIEAGDEKFFDARRALRIGVRLIGVGALWVRQRHRLWGKTPDPSMNYGRFASSSCGRRTTD